MSGRHAAVVLAAGGSTRLGQPKQLLRRDGETLVGRAVRLASETYPACLLVVVGASADGVIPELESVNCKIINNARWQDGLASSLRAAADALPGFEGPVLVLGCDQPALSLPHLTTLLEAMAHGRYRAAAARYGDVSGVPVVVPSAWFTNSDLHGDRGFGQQLRALPRDALFRMEASELRFDIDTPQDAADAVARGWLDAIV